MTTPSPLSEIVLFKMLTLFTEYGKSMPVYHCLMVLPLMITLAAPLPKYIPVPSFRLSLPIILLSVMLIPFLLEISFILIPILFALFGEILFLETAIPPHLEISIAILKLEKRLFFMKES